MARSLKTRGLDELAALRRRVRRQHALGRISRPDMETLVAKCDEIEAIIIKIEERGGDS